MLTLANPQQITYTEQSSKTITTPLVNVGVVVINPNIYSISVEIQTLDPITKNVIAMQNVNIQGEASFYAVLGQNSELSASIRKLAIMMAQSQGVLPKCAFTDNYYPNQGSAIVPQSIIPIDNSPL